MEEVQEEEELEDCLGISQLLQLRRQVYSQDLAEELRWDQVREGKEEDCLDNLNRREGCLMEDSKEVHKEEEDYSVQAEHKHKEEWGDWEAQLQEGCLEEERVNQVEELCSEEEELRSVLVGGYLVVEEVGQGCLEEGHNLWVG